MSSEKIVQQYFYKHVLHNKNSRRKWKMNNNQCDKMAISRNILTMIRHRGFGSPVRTMDKKKQWVFLTSTSQTDHRVLVVAQSYIKIGVANVRHLQQECTDKVTDICIIPHVSISRMAINDIMNRFDHVSIIEPYELNHWCIGHTWVPKHEKLSETSKAQFLKQYNKKDLPSISLNDIIVRINGWIPGDVIHILRYCDPTQEYQHYYRLVR